MFYRPPRIVLTGIHFGWTIRARHQEGPWVSEWLARNNLETNPITIKPETASHMAEQFSWVPVPYCSPAPRLLVKWKSLSCVWLFATLWTIQSMEFSRPEYWSGLPCSSPGNLPNPGIEPRSPTLQADSLATELQGKPSHMMKEHKYHYYFIFLNKLLKIFGKKLDLH